MDSRRRSSLAAGLVLILLGAWFLASQWVPALRIWVSWPLIIVGVGALLLIIGLGGETRQSVRGGLWLVAISLALFAFFGSFLGGLNLFGPYWPALLILLGLLLLVRSLFRPR